jgi:hypothetical protein
MMKTNAKRKNSAAKKLIPAAGMLALSASMLATSTYAWFTMNKEVTVTGMQVHTTVGSNLLISATNANAASYGNDLVQTRQCLLEPSSSINGINYYWTATNNVDAAGNAIAETYTAYNESESWNAVHTDAGKAKYDPAFNRNYGLTSITKDTSQTYNDVAYGYVDYTFYLKAVNTDSSPQAIKLTELDLRYGNDVVTDKAWRAALIVQDAEQYTALNTAPTAANTLSIFTLSGATNFTTTDYAVGDNSGTPTVMDLSYGSSKTAYNQSGTFATIASGAQAYYKVTVRLWLEGEDTTCTNLTYALLSGDYTLDLKFCFDDTDTAVTGIATNKKVTGNKAALGSVPDGATDIRLNGTKYDTVAAANTAITALASDGSYTLIYTPASA